MRCHAPDSQFLGPVACAEFHIIKSAACGGSVHHFRMRKNSKSDGVRHGPIFTTKDADISTI
jgi:hypothetical protein